MLLFFSQLLDTIQTLKAHYMYPRNAFIFISLKIFIFGSKKLLIGQLLEPSFYSVAFLAN
jgi:hypothetical protein